MTNLNLNLPLSAKTAGYDPQAAKAKYQMNSALIKERYHYDRFIGKRKKDGALKLNQLKPEHKQYVSAYINGMKGVEIAEHFGVAAITVYRVLADPLARSLIAEFDESFEDEFRAMFPLVADAIRSGLDEGASPRMRLLAVDRWVKVRKFLDGDDDGEAEQKRGEAQSQARIAFVQTIKRLAPKLEPGDEEILELKAELVETSGA